MSVTLFVPGVDDEGLNLANGNFVRLMALLDVDIDPNDLIGSFAGARLEAFAGQVRFALNAVRSMPALDGGTPDEDVSGETGPRIIRCGLREGYFEDRLSRLLALVETAIESGQPLRFC